MEDSLDDFEPELQTSTSDDTEEESWSMEELADYLRANPLSLMAQNVSSAVFDTEEGKVEFEKKFRSYCDALAGNDGANESQNEDEQQVTFNYLKSFKRVRINYTVGFDAICAKVELHQTNICGSLTNVYLADQPLPNISMPEFLDVPQSDKLFLISPPPSPPVGWEASFEEPPHPAPDLDLSAMNLSASPSNRPTAATNFTGAGGTGPARPPLDTMLLLTAFAHHCSQPGQVVEILPPEDGTPSIMVTSVDGPAYRNDNDFPGGPIPRSPCPPYARWADGDDDDIEDDNVSSPGGDHL